MITPDQLAQYADEIAALYRDLEDSIIRDIAARMARHGVTETSVWQVEQLQQSGGVAGDVYRRIAEIAQVREAVVREVFEDAGTRITNYGAAMREALGMDTSLLQMSAAMQSIMLAGLEKTSGNLRNLTMTTAQAASDAYLRHTNLAYMQVMSGTMSHQQALRGAVKALADEGIHTVTYTKTGKRRTPIDVAVRRNILTGVNQTVARMQLQAASEIGTDLVETSAHATARPTHAVWQGRVFSLSGHSGRYPSFYDVTRYGDVRGLCGANCRHTFYPFVEGLSTRAYSDAQLRAMANRSVTIGGENVPLYEATQEQRALERDIRATKREMVGFSSAMAWADESEMAEYKAGFEEAAARLKRQEKKLDGFLRETGLSKSAARTQVNRFGRSEAQRAVWAVRKAEAIKLPKTAKAADALLQGTLGADIIVGVIPQGAAIEKVRIIAGAGTSSPLRVAQELANTFGGKPLHWQKKGGIINTGNYIYDVHWNELDGKQYWTKIVGVRAK